MKEKNVAKAYAKAIYSLGKESSVDTAKELTTLTETINSCNNLENVMFLDVFTPEEKASVINTVLDKLALSTVVKSFINFLLQEKRVGILPLIIKEVIVMDDHAKGFMRGTIEGNSDSIDTESLNKIKSYIKKELGAEPELTYSKNDKITAGVRVTVEDYQIRRMTRALCNWEQIEKPFNRCYLLRHSGLSEERLKPLGRYFLKEVIGV